MTDVFVTDCAKTAGLNRKKVKMKTKKANCKVLLFVGYMNFYALDEFGFVICNEYEGWFVSLWRNETRKALCALWLSSLQGGLLCILTLKELADEPNIVVQEKKKMQVHMYNDLI